MSFEAHLVELHRIFREFSQENEALRALLDDYVALIEGTPDDSFIDWDKRRIELLARYNALLKGEEQEP